MSTESFPHVTGAIGSPSAQPERDLAAAQARPPLTQRLGFRQSLLLAIALLPLGIISLVQGNAWLDAARNQRAAVLAGETLRVSAPVAGFIREAQGAAAALARTVRPLLDDELACDAAMSHLAALSPQYSVVAYVPVSGQMTCASGGAAYDYSDDSFFQSIIAGLRPTVAVNQQGPVSGTSIVLVAHPVIADEGGYSGYIALALPHSALGAAEPMASSGLGAIDAPDFVTFNRDGTLLTASAGLERAAEFLPQDVTLTEQVTTGQSSFTARTASGQERFYSTVPVIEGELFALGSVPVREAVGFGLLSGLSPFLTAALMWAASLMAAWVAAEHLVSRYIRRLGRAIGSFASGSREVGDLDMEQAPAEIRDVGRAFLRMTDTILHDEAELENTVHQREVLLREVHHRVKNNLQLIASIMNMQSRRARSPETKALMKGLQERVMSLATVHKELYQTTGLADVRADELLSDITQQIVSMASAPGRTFQIETDFAAIPLTPDQAVPLSLLLTEGLTNAIKYAEPDPGESQPRLRLRFGALDGGRVELSIVNGMRPEAEPAPEPEGTGLGRQLVAAFASQLGGEVRTKAEGDLFSLSMEFTLRPLEGGEQRNVV